jgi:hypothetical protein
MRFADMMDSGPESSPEPLETPDTPDAPDTPGPEAVIDEAWAPPYVDAPSPAVPVERVPDAVALDNFPPLSDDLLPRRR